MTGSNPAAGTQASNLLRGRTMITLHIENQLLDDEYDDGNHMLTPATTSELFATLDAAIARISELSTAGYGYSVASGGNADGVEVIIDGQIDTDMVEVVGRVWVAGIDAPGAHDAWLFWDAMPYDDRVSMPILRLAEFRENMSANDEPDYARLDALDVFLQDHDVFWSVVDPDGVDEGNPFHV